MADGIKEEKKKTQKLCVQPFHHCLCKRQKKGDLELVQIRGFPGGGRGSSIIRMFPSNMQACRSCLSARLRCASVWQRSALAGESTRVARSTVFHGDGDGLSAAN